MHELKVRDAMHEGVICCSTEASLEEVAETMRQRHISALVVVKDGRAVGVISQTDLVNASFIRPYMRYWRGMTARHLMSTPVVSISPDAPLHEAIRMVRTRSIHRLVVTASGDGDEQPVGILSLTDIVRRLGGDALQESEREVRP